MQCSVRLIGNVEPQTSAVRAALAGVEVCDDDPQLIVVAGWRHLIPPDVLAQPPLGVVGFHSAKLPEYPGRAPIYWTLLRGDERVYNTMLFLDARVDSGDIIDAESRRIGADDTPETLYEWVAESDARMLTRHLPALLAGTAPRVPQDMTRRGPLTSADGYRRWLNQSS